MDTDTHGFNYKYNTDRTIYNNYKWWCGFLHISSDPHHHLQILQVSLLRCDEHLNGGGTTLQLLEVTTCCQHLPLKHKNCLLHLIGYNEWATGPAVHASCLQPLVRYFFIFPIIIVIVLDDLRFWDDFELRLCLLRAWLDGSSWCFQLMRDEDGREFCKAS